MENSYDENLNENAFFKTFKSEHETVFQKAIFENWIICIPCAESLENYELNEYNISTHVLVPSEELPETHFRTLNDQDVQIYDKVVRVVSICHDVPILFTETFYIDNVRYEVLCLERPLNYNAENCRFNLRIHPVKSLRDCIDLLLLESSDGSTLIEKLDEIIKQFLFLSSKDFFNKTCEQQNNFMKNIYVRCLQITLLDKKLASKVKLNRMFMGNVKISVESYVLHNMYSIVMKGLITNCTSEIGAFNKASFRNLSHVQLQHLNVSDAVLESIPKARSELSRINDYSTVLGKLTCFKRCINLITKNKFKSTNKLSVDELLPILVFLIVKSGITTWMTQLYYVKDFSFSQMDGNHADELSFLVSTMEAVMTYIQSGLHFKMIYSKECELVLIDEGSKECDDADVCSYVCGKSKLYWKTKNQFLLKLFQVICNDDLENVKSFLDEPEEEVAAVVTATQTQYCHPLCSCDKCEKLQTTSTQQASLTVNTVNNSGCSALHVAACYGKSVILDWLINRGANPNCKDFSGSTPLHCAAAHGHQNTVLLLMYADAKLDQRDDDGNQPLHVAAANGHVDCVKALLYFAEHAGIRYDVNGTNKDGDTPLHLAVKYHKEVTEILLVYNANPSIKNKHSSNAFELSESLKIISALNENACKITARDRNNCTPLHYACSAGNARIVELLLKYEPDVEAKNDKGKTPLNEAEESLSFAVMRLM